MPHSRTDRRHFLRVLAGVFLTSRIPRAWAELAPKPAVPASPWTLPFAETGDANGAARDNFAVIFSDPALREDFKNFLVNVYHLYPEDKFQQLILEASRKGKTDEEIYRELQRNIPSIKPFLSEVTYALPALAKQKEEMSSQAAQLIGAREVNGYVEIGTPGRYVAHLRTKVKLQGRVTLVHDHEPGFDPADLAERGGLAKAGDYVPLDRYAAWTEAQIGPESVDVISNFIGIHHAPRDRLDPFLRSLHRALRPGGLFLLRDHDAHSRELNAMVGLAHDVYNAGLGLPWERNEQELRYFKPLGAIHDYLARMGFAKAAEPLYQRGDPTKNALLLYVKKT